MRAASRLALALALLALGAAGFAGCFSLKEPPCAFTCVEAAHRCPESYTCGDDGLCHREGATATCGLTSPFDAGVDASSSDATD